MMAYREYDDEILRDYFTVTVMDVDRALLSEAERDKPTRPEMYKIKEAFDDMLDDSLWLKLSAREESLQVQSCTSSEPMRGRAAPQMTCDAAVSVEHLDTGMRPAVAETSEESGEPGGLLFRGHSREQARVRAVD